MRKVYVHYLFGRFENLAKLKILELSHSKFQQLPSAVYNLSNLTQLDVSHSEKLVRIDEQILKLTNLQHLLCDDCKLLEYPPYAVCEQGLSAVQKYFTDLITAKGIELTELPDVITGKQCLENLISYSLPQGSLIRCQAQLALEMICLYVPTVDYQI